MKLIIFGLTFAVLATLIQCDPKIVVGEYKGRLELDCSDLADGVEFHRPNSTNGTDTVKVLEKQDKFKYDGKKLVISDLRGEEIKTKFTCVKDGSTLREFKFEVKPKLFKPDKASQTVTEGGFVELKCLLLFGAENDLDITWIWTRNNSELVSDDQYAIKQSNNQTSLTIKKAKQEDKGNYKCMAKNTHGDNEEIITIRVKDALAALWPFLAIVVEVVLLCLIILIYEKRCAKKPASEEDNEQAQNLMGREQNPDLKKRSGK